MKNQFYILLFFALLLVVCQGNKKSEDGHAHDHSAAQVPAESAPDSKKSIPQEAHEQVGETHLTIKYHSPTVRGRVIWGGLVPYDEVWVAGAHSATSVEFSKAVEMEGTTIPKGKYAFFAVPDKEQWTLILNKNWEQHLTDEYNQSEDILRVNVTPETGLALSERLTYTIEDLGEGNGSITMQWENLRVSLIFKED
jgi:hypothetical protein